MKRKTLNSIMILEDDEINSLIHYSLIHNMQINCEIICAQNGKDGLDIISQRGKMPDLVLVDLTMPVIDGYEFLQCLNDLVLDDINHSLIYVMDEVAEMIDVPRLFNTKVKGILLKPLKEEHVMNILLDNFE
jgi:CheY-like chemotaxis protein